MYQVRMLNQATDNRNTLLPKLDMNLLRLAIQLNLNKQVQLSGLAPNSEDFNHLSLGTRRPLPGPLYL